MTSNIDDESNNINSVDQITADTVDLNSSSQNPEEFSDSALLTQRREVDTNAADTADLNSSSRNPEESSDSALLTQREKEPFNGKYKPAKLVKSNHENNTEYRFFGEVKVTGDDSLIIKEKDNVEFYFALQVWNKKPSSNMTIQIRQGDIYCDKWILLMCMYEPDNSDRCSAVFISKEWFEKNRATLQKTALLDNILLTSEARTTNILMIYNIDKLLAMSPDDPSSSISSINIFNKTGFVPNHIDYRFSLLKVLKGAIYNATDIIKYVNHPCRSIPETIPETIPQTNLKAQKGCRETGYTRQSNALKQLGLRNNLFGDASKNIIQTSLVETDIRIKRNLTKKVDPYQSVIDEVALKKAKSAATRKRKKENKSQTPTVHAINTTTADSAAAKEILMLKKQLTKLQDSLKSSSNAPPAAVIKVEAVVDNNNNKNIQSENKKPYAKRNKKSPIVEDTVLIESSINESKVDEKNRCIGSNNSVSENPPKREKRKSKKDKQNALIISLLEKNNGELVKMKHRIHFLEGNNSLPQQPLNHINSNTSSSQMSITTPLIERHFPSQQATNTSNDNRMRSDSSNQLQPNFTDAILSSTPRQPVAAPYFVQNPYFVTTPQGMIMQPNAMFTQQSNQAMFTQQNNQDVNRHFFDYAMLEFFNRRH